MGRIERQYVCTCDGCRQLIENVNDENDVTMNSAKYVYCPRCYNNICSLQEVGFQFPSFVDTPVAWYDPDNPTKITFDRATRHLLPMTYPTPLYRGRG